VLAFIVCWALRGLWQHTFHPFLSWLGHLGLSFSVLGHGVSIHPFGFANKLDRAIFNYMTDAMYASERAVVYGINGMVSTFWWLVNETEHGADALLRVTHGLWHAIHHGAVAQTGRTLTKTIVRKLTVVEHKVVTVARGLTKTQARELAHVTALANAIARELPRIKTLEREEKAIAARVRGIEGKLTAVGIVGLLGVALTRMGLGWVRCAGVGRLGRALCNASTRWIDDLVGLFADFYILTHICAVIPWLEDGFAVIAEPMIAELAAVGAGLCDPSYAGGPALSVPDLHLPAAGYTLHLPS